MINFAGLSAVYPGFMAQEDQTAKTQQNQAAAREAAIKLLGAHVLGQALTGQEGPQPPAPGQPSVSNQPPLPPSPQVNGVPTPGQMPFGTPPSGNPPANAAPPPQVMAPNPGQASQADNAQGGAPTPGKLPEISLQSLSHRILQASPGVRNHPEIFLAALERAAPMLDRQGKEELAEAKNQFSMQRLQLAKDQLAEAQRAHDMVNSRNEARIDQGNRRLDQADVREKRLVDNSAIRNDTMVQRLQLQQQDLQRKIEAGDRGAALSAWRATTDALHKRATEVIQSGNQFNTMEPEEKKALLAEQRKAYEGQISAMRDLAGGTTPRGGTVAPGVPIPPKVEGRVEPSAPGLTAPASPPTLVPVAAPPLAVLKPGHVTTFANGQKWTVGSDGQPKQVQ